MSVASPSLESLKVDIKKKPGQSMVSYLKDVAMARMQSSDPAVRIVGRTQAEQLGMKAVTVPISAEKGGRKHRKKTQKRKGGKTRKTRGRK